MPRRLYAMTRVQAGKIIQNPVLITKSLSLASSKQVWAYLLCKQCEDRFNNGGERYTLTQVHDGITFPLLNRMTLSLPFQVAPSLGVSLYSATAMGVQWDQLAYFAMSIFWRGSVHQWTLQGGNTAFNSLGPHEPAVRAYLLGQAPFPPELTLIVTVATDWQSQGSFWTPAVVVGSAIPSLGLLTRGIHFRLFLGSNLPAGMSGLCITAPPRHVIALGDCLKISGHAFGNLMKTSRPARSLRTIMP